MTFELRARLSFPGASRDLPATAHIMAAWAEAAARAMAPELRWRADVVETEDGGDGERFRTIHVVRLAGTDASGVQRGRGESRLVAGGDAKRLGGNGLVDIETVRPLRYLSADNHCNVEHWDVVAAPIDEHQLEGIRRALEDLMGTTAHVAGERRDPIAPSAQLLVESASTDDAALWMEDLAGAGLACRGHAAERGVALFVDHAALDDVGALEVARVTLGEVLSEAGHDDWDQRWRELLVRLPVR